MQYDFTTVIDRSGTSSRAVDVIPIPGAQVKEGFSPIPMWIADMSFATVPTIPQAIANGYVKPVDFGDDLTVMMPCPPVKFSEYEAREYTPAGLLGQDTDRVFEGLGYSPSEIENMKEAGAIK